jgi:hypothetical protein
MSGKMAPADARDDVDSAVSVQIESVSSKKQELGVGLSHKRAREELEE